MPGKAYLLGLLGGDPETTEIQSTYWYETSYLIGTAHA